MHSSRASLICTLLASILAGCGGGGPPSGPNTPSPIPTALPTPLPLDQKAFTEALFLGSGPYSDPASIGCNRAGQMTGWASGSIRIRVGTSVPEMQRLKILRVAEQVSAATNGRISATFEMTDVAYPIVRNG